LGTAAGCSSSGSETDRRSAQTAYDEGTAAFVRKDYAVARDSLSQALIGGLYADLCDDALAMRAVCHAALGDLPAAQADIDALQRGGADESLSLAAQSFVLDKQGKGAEAKAAAQKAKLLNPQVRTFH
jgi:hypothetical protein